MEAEKKKKSSFFSCFYLSINIGALAAASCLVWIQTSVGRGWGFGILAVAMAFPVDITVYSHELKKKNLNYITREPDEERERRNSGTKLYRNQRPGGCPFDLHLPLVASLRKFRSLLYETAESKICCHRKPFFDKAAMETPSDSIKGSINAWRLCTVTQVEELKSIIRLLPIWASGIVFSAVYSQMGTLFVLQGTGPRESCPIFARIHIAFSSISAHHQTHHSAPKSFSLSLYSTTGELLK
ncbi:hypothetical protein ACOSQ4_029701 [Xanthoceras sorbifolium]